MLRKPFVRMAIGAAALLAAGAFSGLATTRAAAAADKYPSKPVRVVVGFAPGGPTDVMARLIAQKLSENLKQQFFVENHPGAGGNIGMMAVARSPADGYTLLVVFPSFIVNPSLRSNMSFDPLKDFRAVGQTLAVPMVIAAHPSVPANNLQELIALARAKPGELSYGTPGLGTTHHVMGELLKLTAKINIIHAPFQGGGPSLAAVTGGHIQLVYGNANEVAPSAKTGKVKPIVVTCPLCGEQRRYLPSEVFLGLPHHLVTKEARKG